MCANERAWPLPLFGRSVIRPADRIHIFCGTRIKSRPLFYFIFLSITPPVRQIFLHTPRNSLVDRITRLADHNCDMFSHRFGHTVQKTSFEFLQDKAETISLIPRDFATTTTCNNWLCCCCSCRSSGPTMRVEWDDTFLLLSQNSIKVILPFSLCRTQTTTFTSAICRGGRTWTYVQWLG